MGSVELWNCWTVRGLSKAVVESVAVCLLLELETMVLLWEERTLFTMLTPR